MITFSMSELSFLIRVNSCDISWSETITIVQRWIHSAVRLNSTPLLRVILQNTLKTWIIHSWEIRVDLVTLSL